MSDSVRYAVCCLKCGHIEDKAWTPASDTEHSKRTDKPLTPQGHVPIYCQKCGQRSWQKPATKEQIEKFDNKARQEARAIELTGREDFEGIFKIPDELKAPPEIKRALSNLLAPLEGDQLKAAQTAVMRIVRMGGLYESNEWIERYEKAIEKAVQSTPAKKSA
jgi:hypothetical protein